MYCNIRYTIVTSIFHQWSCFALGSQHFYRRYDRKDVRQDSKNNLLCKIIEQTRCIGEKSTEIHVKSLHCQRSWIEQCSHKGQASKVYLVQQDFPLYFIEVQSLLTTY